MDLLKSMIFHLVRMKASVEDHLLKASKAFHQILLCATLVYQGSLLHQELNQFNWVISGCGYY